MKSRGRQDTGYYSWDREVGPTIKVAIDDVGPLVYAVQGGKFLVKIAMVTHRNRIAYTSLNITNLKIHLNQNKSFQVKFRE